MLLSIFHLLNLLVNHLFTVNPMYAHFFKILRSFIMCSNNPAFLSYNVLAAWLTVFINHQIYTTVG